MMISTHILTINSPTSKLKKCDILIYEVLNKYLTTVVITSNNHHLAFNFHFLDGTFCAVLSFPVDGNH